MGHKHTKGEILAGALASKDDLVDDVLTAVGARLQQILAPAFTAPAADHVALARAAWPVLAHPSADPVFALFFEANGLATAGRTPYVRAVPRLVEAWIDRVSHLIEGPCGPAPDRGGDDDRGRRRSPAAAPPRRPRRRRPRGPAPRDRTPRRRSLGAR